LYSSVRHALAIAGGIAGIRSGRNVKLSVLTTRSKSSPFTRQPPPCFAISRTGVESRMRGRIGRAMPSVIAWNPPRRG
jgi:hypothetical protein